MQFGMHLSLRKKELLSMVCLGLGESFVLTPLRVQLFLLIPIVRCVSQTNDAIKTNDAPVGISMFYVSSALAALATPWLSYEMGPKWTLFSGSLLATLYHVGFFFLNAPYFFASSIMLGVGNALTRCGRGFYYSEQSLGRHTLLYNAAVATAVANGGTFFIGIFLLCMENTFLNINSDGFDFNETESQIDYLYDYDNRYFVSPIDVRILVLCALMLGGSVLSNILFSNLPVIKREILISAEMLSPVTFKNNLAQMFKAIFDWHVFPLIPIFFSQGFIFHSVSAISATDEHIAQVIFTTSIKFIILASGANFVSFILLAMGTRNTPMLHSIPMVTCSIIFFSLAYFQVYDRGRSMSLLISLVIFAYGTVDASYCAETLVATTRAHPMRRLHVYSLELFCQAVAVMISVSTNFNLFASTWSLFLSATLQTVGICGYLYAVKLADLEDTRTLLDFKAANEKN